MSEELARRIARVAVASLLGASSLVAVGRAQTDLQGTSLDPQNFVQIERGRYLAVAGDCASCHTVPGSGEPFAGGRPIETPFGIVVAANITPDRETGIGAWSDELFCLLAVWHGLRLPNPCRRRGLIPPEMFLGSAEKGRFFVPA